LIIQTFYNGLVGSLRSIIDAAAGGSLMLKPFDETYSLIEEMATNNFQWPAERINLKKIASIHDSDAISMLASQIAAISRKLDNFNQLTTTMVEENSSGQFVDVQPTYETLNAINNRTNNPYSNYYNPGWKNHPNFNWNNNSTNPQWANNSVNPIGNPSTQGNPNYKNPYPPGFNNNYHVKEKKLSMEEVIINMGHQLQNQGNQLQIQGNQLQNQGTTIKNIELQLGHIATALSNRTQGTLPSNVEINPKDQGKEQIKAIQLRSGKELETRIQKESEIQKDKIENENETDNQTIDLENPIIPMKITIEKP
ncbi:hypothetical protein G6046_06920, partial [Bacillus amyloliquefaciens]|nr:hypothetical protein [Bacillus amyloliquefaciens]